MCVFLSRLVISDSCDPMNCSPPDSFVHGILQARILEWAVIPKEKRNVPIASKWKIKFSLSPFLLHCGQLVLVLFFIVCLFVFCFLISQTYLLERIELFVAKVFAHENKQLKCHFLQPQGTKDFVKIRRTESKTDSSRSRNQCSDPIICPRRH